MNLVIFAVAGGYLYFVQEIQERKSSLNIKFLGGIFLGHQEPRRRDIPDENFMQVALFCCFRQGMASISPGFGSGRPGIRKTLPLMTKLLHTVFLFCFGELLSVIITGNFTA